MLNTVNMWVPKNLSKILDEHRKWLDNPDTGQRADLSYADLKSMNGVFLQQDEFPFSYIDFSYADLRGLHFNPDTIMTHCNFQSANLAQTGLGGVDLSFCNFHKTYMAHACLQEALLPGCNFKYANLHNAVGNGHEIQSFNISGMSFVYTDNELQIGLIDRRTYGYWRDFVQDNLPHDDVDHWLRGWLKDKMPIVEMFLKTMPAMKRWLPIQTSDMREEWIVPLRNIPIKKGHHDMHEYRPPGETDKLNVVLSAGE